MKLRAEGRDLARINRRSDITATLLALGTRAASIAAPASAMAPTGASALIASAAFTRFLPFAPFLGLGLGLGRGAVLVAVTGIPAASSLPPPVFLAAITPVEFTFALGSRDCGRLRLGSAKKTL